MNTITIEKDVPIPSRPSGSYPFDQLDVGDSFSVPVRSRNSVSTYLKKFGKKRFITRTQSDDTVRVWRIE